MKTTLLALSVAFLSGCMTTCPNAACQQQRASALQFIALQQQQQQAWSNQFYQTQLQQINARRTSVTTCAGTAAPAFGDYVNSKMTCTSQ